MPDLTNQQLLSALGDRFDHRFNGVDRKLDSLEAMISGIGDTVAAIADTMATQDDLRELEARIDARLHGFEQSFQSKLDDVELRLGRRIDGVLVTKTT